MSHPSDVAVDELVAALGGLGLDIALEPARPIERLEVGIEAGLSVVPVSEPEAVLTHDGAPTVRRELTVMVIVHARNREVRSTVRASVEAAILDLRQPNRQVGIEAVEYGRGAEGDQLYMAGLRVRLPYLATAGVSA